MAEIGEPVREHQVEPKPIEVPQEEPREAPAHPTPAKPEREKEPVKE